MVEWDSTIWKSAEAVFLLYCNTKNCGDFDIVTLFLDQVTCYWGF